MNLFLWVLQAPIMQLLRVIWEEQGRPTVVERPRWLDGFGGGAFGFGGLFF